jgi:hypothetical protein
MNRCLAALAGCEVFEPRGVCWLTLSSRSLFAHQLPPLFSFREAFFSRPFTVPAPQLSSHFKTGSHYCIFCIFGLWLWLSLDDPLLLVSMRCLTSLHAARHACACLQRVVGGEVVLLD